MWFRRATIAGVLLSALALIGAGAASAAGSVTNIYRVTASISPVKSGTSADPRPVSSRLEWDVGTAQGSLRPGEVSRYLISYQGLDENTTLFPRCSASRLSAPNSSPYSCPAKSRIGSGFVIFQLGATGFPSAPYSPGCSSSLALFNAGHHHLTLFVYEGRPLANQPAECTIPGRHVAIKVTLHRSGAGLTEAFSFPEVLLHPAPGLDTAVVQAVLNVPAKQRVLRQRIAGQPTTRRVGLFESYFCPASHRRRVAMTFTRQDGTRQSASTFVRCR